MEKLNIFSKTSNFNDMKMNQTDYNTNTYEQKIKEGIPFFKTFDRGMNYPNLIDPFQILEESKSNINLKDPFLSNINMSDIEVKKMFEREMNPYLLLMKKELKMMIDQFKKKIEDKANLFDEIEVLKNELEMNKKNNEINFSNLENKLLNINDTINSHNNKLNHIQNNLDQINQYNIELNKKNNELYENLNKLQRNNNADIANNNNIYKEITTVVENITGAKLGQLEKNIELIKDENTSIKSDISKNVIKLDLLTSENDKKNKILRETELTFQKINNQINAINQNSSKNLKIIENFDLKNNELNQKLKLINDTISNINERINALDIEMNSNLSLINSNTQKIMSNQSNINSLRNEEQILNNNFIELNLKVESQAEKISKYNNLLNDTINHNNNSLYKDLTGQLAKMKDLLESIRDNYDSELSKIKNDLQQFEIILKNNPFLNLNDTERLSTLFKKEQLQANMAFKEDIKNLVEEMKKVKMDRQNFKTIESNFKKLSGKLEGQNNEINSIADSLKLNTSIVKDLSERFNKIKKELNSNKNKNEGISTNEGMFMSELRANEIDKMKKNIKSHKDDIEGIKIDVKLLNEKTIPEIYNYINKIVKEHEFKIDKFAYENKSDAKKSEKSYGIKPKNLGKEKNIYDLAEEIEKEGIKKINNNILEKSLNNSNKINESIQNSNFVEKDDSFINKIIKDGQQSNNNNNKLEDFDSNFDS